MGMQRLLELQNFETHFTEIPEIFWFSSKPEQEESSKSLDFL